MRNRRPKVRGPGVREELRRGHHARRGPGAPGERVRAPGRALQPVRLLRVVPTRLGEVGVGGVVEVAGHRHGALRRQRDVRVHALVAVTGQRRPGCRIGRELAPEHAFHEVGRHCRGSWRRHIVLFNGLAARSCECGKRGKEGPSGKHGSPISVGATRAG